MKKIILAATVVVLAFGAAAAHASGSIVEARRGCWNNYGPGGDYYMQQYPGPNCYSQPHPVYGWICY
jgi:Spy/CpxP family protein refolding chaperone